MTKVKYCDTAVIVDGYFTHYMGDGNTLETAKIITRLMRGLHEVSKTV